MKYLLSLILSIGLLQFTFAECTFNGFAVFPKSKTIPENGIIILEGYAESQKVVNALNKVYPVYLQSKHHRVELDIQNIYKGMYRLTQAILVPKELLIPGQSYVLKIDDLPEYERFVLKQWNCIEHKEGKTSLPTLKSLPRFIDNSLVHYGCGPKVYAHFKLDINNHSTVFVKTELKDVESGKTHVYYLNTDALGRVNIGHDMCAGAFDYKSRGKHQVRFKLMDLSGNESEIWTEWVMFDSPYKTHG